MKILILSFYYEPDLCAGSFRTTALTEELKKRMTLNDTLDIITTMPNRYSSFNDDALNYEEDGSIRINRINLGTHKSGFIDQSLLFIKFACNVINIIRKREKYDLIYATSSRLMTAFLGALISNRQNSKLFLDLRDIFTDTLESVFAKSKLRYIIPIFKQIEKYTINSASHINLVSKGFEEYFLNINNTVKYSFNSNGIDNIFLDFDFDLKNENKKKIITYAGNIGEGQGLEKIIPDLAKIVGENFEIHIYGDGGRKSILVNKSEGLFNIKLFDPINRKKLLEVYKNSDYLFLHLNDYDAFKKVLPSKLFEYATTNKFIIAGVSGYAKKFINENISSSIVFEPCNVNDFEKKFKEIDFYEKIERKDFIKKFSRSKIMNDLSKKVYEV